MNDPYEKERDIEYASHQRGEIDSDELAKRIQEIDRQEYADAQERAQDAYDRTMNDSGFGRF